jgi:zinc D-Ala-D-Ala carboxypeptidase
MDFVKNIQDLYGKQLDSKLLRDLNAKIPGATNFKYGELIRSDTASRFGITNLPDEQIWQNLEVLAKNVIQPIRTHFGPIRINSGFRSSEVNVKIGGSTTSNHCRGEAADIEPYFAQATLVEVIEWVVENLEFRTVILEYPPDGWVHIDYRIGGNLQRLKLKDPTHNYTSATIDYIKMLYN